MDDDDIIAFVLDYEVPDMVELFGHSIHEEDK